MGAGVETGLSTAITWAVIPFEARFGRSVRLSPHGKALKEGVSGLAYLLIPPCPSTRLRGPISPCPTRLASAREVLFVTR